VSLRRRITLVSAAAVAIAVVLASVLIYVLTSNQLHRQVDAQLARRGESAGRLLRLLGGKAPSVTSSGRLALPGGGSIATPGTTGAGTLLGRPEDGLLGRLPASPDQVRGYQQLVDASGKAIIRSQTGVTLPVDAATRALAAHGGAPVYSQAHVQGRHLRILAEPFGSGRALQFAEPLTEVDELLSRLRLILVLLDIGGIALAALLGRLVAGAAVQPVKRLTSAAEHVTLTQDLSGRIPPSGTDELGRLATNFNAMLDALESSMAALDASVHAQRQLVADASHELRTPVTSLRTNIEILQLSGPAMDPEDHRRLLADVVEQLEELTLLINDLIDLARGEEPRADVEEVRVDQLVFDVVERARRRRPSHRISFEGTPTLLRAVPDRLERAVGNLLDNAIKFSPPSGSVEVRLGAAALTVRDHGPGIPADELPYVFDRFYRGAQARGRPGSGLGLAIVSQVAGQLGGTITARDAPGGGTLMTLTLPRAEPMESGGEAVGELTGLAGG
jgi:two-component system sensor histidine kinase MprB